MESESSSDYTVTPHHLCELCRSMFAVFSQEPFWASESYKRHEEGHLLLDHDVIGKLGDPVEYHENLSSLERSAEQGCHLCALFFGGRFGQDDTTDTHSQLYVHVERHSFQGCGSLSIYMYENYLISGKGTRDLSKVELHRHSDLSEPGHCHLKGENRSDSTNNVLYKWSSNTDCDFGYELMDGWLQDCIENHSDCGRPLGKKIRPSRLLDLSSQDLNFIRLIQTGDAEVDAYATLSYRWGGSSNVLLKADNYLEFTNRIEVSSLPRTIRDAIKVCRHLNIHYLWVDALCIIQEDNSDFARELSQMGSIYAGSRVTIAAADSTDSDSGLFRERVPLQREECIVPAGASTYLFSRMYFPSSPHYDKIGNTKLCGRAWVYQERFLAPRTIHFTSQEIIWECRQRTVCHNCYQSESDQPVEFKYDSKRALLSMYADIAEYVKVAFFRLFWSTIVSRYSRCVLTNNDDRLCALAGVAQLGRHELDDNSSYGLWLDNLVNELLWATGDAKITSTSENNVLGAVPSWSWASTSGQVRYLNPSSPYVRVEQLVLECASLIKYPPVTHFGPITAISGEITQTPTIRICGGLRACQSVPILFAPVPNSPVGWSLVTTSSLRETATESYVKEAWTRFREGASRTGLDVVGLEEMGKYGLTKTVFYIPDEEPSEQQEVFCLLLKRVLGHEREAPRLPQQPSMRVPRTSVTDFGIVLSPTNSTHTRFRRVGYFHEFVHDGFDKQSPKELEARSGRAGGKDVSPELWDYLLNYWKCIGLVRRGDDVPSYAYGLNNAFQSWFDNNGMGALQDVESDSDGAELSAVSGNGSGTYRDEGTSGDPDNDDGFFGTGICNEEETASDVDSYDSGSYDDDGEDTVAVLIDRLSLFRYNEYDEAEIELQ